MATLAIVTNLRVLFLGGTGIISSACVRSALEVGHDVTVLNRGTTDIRPLPDQVRSVMADVRDPTAVASAAGDGYDVVLDFPVVHPGSCAAPHRWVGRADRPVRVHQLGVGLPDPAGPVCRFSKARRCATPFGSIPGTRSPVRSCSWTLTGNMAFPVTIVRPSHTYDRTMMAVRGWMDSGRTDAAWRASRHSRATVRHCGRSPTTLISPGHLLG